MYELLRQRLARGASDEEKLNRTREFIQVLILKLMFDRGEFAHLAFVGGTALRICYGLRRFSEDLDFNLVRRRGYDFRALLDRLAYDLTQHHVKVELKSKESGAIQHGFIRFPGAREEIGLPGTRAPKLSIKLEIDTRTPRGWKNRLYPVSEPFVFTINGFDLPSLYATKLHACFFRPYTKGRDFYDLAWYLGKRVEPNYVLLNNAIRQTDKKAQAVGPENFREFLREGLRGVDFRAIRRDVERFLEDKGELKLLSRETMLKMAEGG